MSFFRLCGTRYKYLVRVSGWGVCHDFLPDTSWNCPFPFMLKFSLVYFRYSSWPSGQLHSFRRNTSVSHRQKCLFRWNLAISLRQQRAHERHRLYLFIKSTSTKCSVLDILCYCMLEHAPKRKNVGPGPVTIPQCKIYTPWNALEKCTRQSPDSNPVNHQYVLVIQNMLANKTRSVHQYVSTFFDFPDFCPVGLRENPVICPVKQTWWMASRKHRIIVRLGRLYRIALHTWTSTW
jgi:hypothetical protein